jgi:hypothetical protein
MAGGNGRIRAKEMRVMMVEYSRAPSTTASGPSAREPLPPKRSSWWATARGQSGLSMAGLSMHNELPPGPAAQLLCHVRRVRYPPCNALLLRKQLPAHQPLAILEDKHLCEHPIASLFYMNEGLSMAATHGPLAEKDGLCDSALYASLTRASSTSRACPTVFWARRAPWIGRAQPSSSWLTNPGL